MQNDVIIGKKVWAIAEGYIPSGSTGPKPDLESHETLCVLNTSDQTANIEVLIYFEDKDPVGPYKLSVPPHRTKHFKFNDFNDPAEIPRDTAYASKIESDIPVVVQYTRLDSRQSENAIFTSIAFS
ncbi:MAG TPA: sensory rhodopsin transducer [Anditalea sp.]|nr:sensory rhodopsin transducer [Anditalea sp.]